jgi:guanyl-specific ribonuclease Sa
LTGGAQPNIPKLDISDLYRCRPEAKATVQAIKRDGPFQFRQDDTVFFNREGILPPKPRGAYHEYTVITPGAATRGTRRILTGGDPDRQPSDYDNLYYTDDHYQTVWLVVDG